MISGSDQFLTGVERIQPSYPIPHIGHSAMIGPIVPIVHAVESLHPVKFFCVSVKNETKDRIKIA